ncbi:regulator of chromosome condensation [Xylariaceae sp. FL0662B]|nr:regulator of chromosome condensation [Xylariaceae sp. FL0662B]
MPFKKSDANSKGQGQPRSRSRPLHSKVTFNTTTNDVSVVASSSRKRKFPFNNTEKSRKAPRRAKTATTTSEPGDRTSTRSATTWTPTASAAKQAKTTLTKKVKADESVSLGSAPTSLLRIINKAPTQVLQVIVFGSGECGELGLGPNEKEKPRPFVNPFLSGSGGGPDAFHVVQLDCGGMHTVALTNDNKIITWGVNDRGALGRDTAWDGGLRDVDAESDNSEDESLNPLESTPTQIPADRFPPGTKFVQVVAGDSCSFALTDTGLVYGWGTFLDAEGKPRFIYTNKKLIEVLREPSLIPGIANITQLACGKNHAIALDQTGNVWAWGVGQKNQLGYHLFESSRQYSRRLLESLKPRRVNLRRNRAKYIASGLEHSFAVDRKDNVWAWGLNRFGQAGYAKEAGSDNICLPYPMKIAGLAGKGVAVLSGGADHSAAVTADGQCLVWGRIDGGQLGVELDDEQLQDDTLTRRDDRGHPRICLRPVAVPNIGAAAYVSCGTGHTIFVSTEGRAYGAGFGSLGQLGIASNDDANVAERITGAAIKNKRLTWCGAGGLFSMVATPAEEAAP